jgi:predicted membrane protein
MEKTEKTGASLASKALAVVVLAVAAWILLKVVLSVIAGIAWIVVAVVLVVGVLWAFNTLSR